MGKRGPSPQMTDNELVEIVRENSPPGVTAASVSKQVDLSRQRCGERLAMLSEDGVIKRQDLSSVVLYWSESTSGSDG
jgi:DNA-binding Lrp family transcriptional regulator